MEENKAITCTRWYPGRSWGVGLCKLGNDNTVFGYRLGYPGASFQTFDVTFFLKLLFTLVSQSMQEFFLLEKGDKVRFKNVDMRYRVCASLVIRETVITNLSSCSSARCFFLCTLFRFSASVLYRSSLFILSSLSC